MNCRIISQERISFDLPVMWLKISTEYDLAYDCELPQCPCSHTGLGERDIATKIPARQLALDEKITRLHCEEEIDYANNNEKYLNRLIGKRLLSTRISTSTVLPINGNGKELYTIANSLHFEDYRLDINNPITFIPADKDLESLIGLKVIGTDERKEEAEIIFDNGFKLIVNMRDEVYYDPESMVLNGPNSFCAVWN